MAGEGEVRQHIPYNVTGQEKTRVLAAGGQFVEVWRISFEAPNGTHAYVDVPLKEYNPARVDQRIEAVLDNIMGVANLGAQPHPTNLAQ